MSNRDDLTLKLLRCCRARHKFVYKQQETTHYPERQGRFLDPTFRAQLKEEYMVQKGLYDLAK
jgi:hypothetical protein